MARKNGLSVFPKRDRLANRKKGGNALIRRRVFLSGLGCTICYNNIGLEFTSAPNFVGISSERIYFLLGVLCMTGEYQLKS
jgi:hypothetical protein